MKKDKIKIIVAAIAFVVILILGLGYTFIGNNNDNLSNNAQNVENTQVINSKAKTVNVYKK